MEQMEYKVVHIPDVQMSPAQHAEASGNLLNNAASGGWRLVSVSGPWAYFEREKPQEGAHAYAM